MVKFMTVIIWLKFLRKKIRYFFDILKPYGSLLAAFGTIFLATVTVFHIDEARKMRRETKRLVDTTIEQFKIESYPSFFITNVQGPSIESNNIVDSMKIINKGSISAFHVTIMLLHRYQGKKDTFQRLMDSVYVDEKERSTLDFERKFLPDSVHRIESRKPLEKVYSIDNLRTLLGFIRFKVPYDDKYSYEEKAYIKEVKEKKPDTTSYGWEELNREDTIRHVRNCLTALSFPKSPAAETEVRRVKKFFRDYRIK